MGSTKSRLGKQERQGKTLAASTTLKLEPDPAIEAADILCGRVIHRKDRDWAEAIIRAACEKSNRRLMSDLAISVAKSESRAATPKAEPHKKGWEQWMEHEHGGAREKLAAAVDALEWYASTIYPDDGSGRPSEALQRRAKDALAKIGERK